jgi:hypothetical protein
VGNPVFRIDETLEQNVILEATTFMGGRFFVIENRKLGKSTVYLVLALAWRRIFEIAVNCRQGQTDDQV